MSCLVDSLYCCILMAPGDRDRATDTLLSLSLNGMTATIPYRLWTLEEDGALCLAIPLNPEEPAHSPERRSAACFHPVAPAALDRSLLMNAQERAATMRHLVRARGLTLPEEVVLLYVSEQPGEIILSLKCEDDSPSWDQRVWLARLVKDNGWNWQVIHLRPQHNTPSGEPAICPTYAWKHVAPPTSTLLLASLRAAAGAARAGQVIAVELEDGTEALGWVERQDGCDQGQDLIRVVWLRPTGPYVQAWYTDHLQGHSYSYESTLPATPDRDFVWHGLKRFGSFRILTLAEVRLLWLEQVAGPDTHHTMQRSIAHAYGGAVDVLGSPDEPTHELSAEKKSSTAVFAPSNLDAEGRTLQELLEFLSTFGSRYRIWKGKSKTPLSPQACLQSIGSSHPMLRQRAEVQPDEVTLGQGSLESSPGAWRVYLYPSFSGRSKVPHTAKRTAYCIEDVLDVWSVGAWLDQQPPERVVAVLRYDARLSTFLYTYYQDVLGSVPKDSETARLPLWYVYLEGLIAGLNPNQRLPYVEVRAETLRDWLGTLAGIWIEVRAEPGIDLNDGDFGWRAEDPYAQMNAQLERDPVTLPYHLSEVHTDEGTFRLQCQDEVLSITYTGKRLLEGAMLHLLDEEKICVTEGPYMEGIALLTVPKKRGGYILHITEAA